MFYASMAQSEYVMLLGNLRHENLALQYQLFGSYTRYLFVVNLSLKPFRRIFVRVSDGATKTLVQNIERAQHD